MAYLNVNVGNGHSVNVDFNTKGVIRVRTDGNLIGAMGNVPDYKIIDSIENQYQYQWREKINISSLSLQYELVGHVYPGILSRVIAVHPLIPNTVKDYVKGLEVIPRTAVVDMGEAGKDSNRNIWDTLANVTKRMLTGPVYP